MENKTNKNFCIQPFVNVTTRIKGNNNVCCNINLPASNIKNESPNQFFNSKSVAKMRKALLNGDRVDACRLCHYQEKNSGNSHRIEYNKYYKLKNNQTHDYYLKMLDRLRITKINKPLYAEVHVSNLCNLKCLTCVETDSSQFHAENKLLGISKHPGVNFTKFVVDTAKAVEDVIHPGLLFLDIRGGETLMVPEIKKILMNVDNSMAKNITLKIQTNGTILPDAQWTDIFRKFKNTKINVSIDAYGEDNHYIRYPAKWEQILATLKYFKDQDIKFIINTVVSNLNISVIDKLFSWIQHNRYLNYFYILDWPRHYRPNNLPQSVLDIAVKRLQNVEKNFVNKDNDQKLSDLIEMCAVPDQAKNWERFCKEINMRDKHRKNSITSVVPEIKEYIHAKI